MHTIPNSSSAAQRRGGNVSEIKHAPAGQTKSAVETETKSERAERFYKEAGGANNQPVVLECSNEMPALARDEIEVLL